MIGIYALYWWKQDLIYVGQSTNISGRFKEHLRKLKLGKHTNFRVTNAFNLYGLPELRILEECNLDNLNDLEISWTAEFDSLHGLNGLNIIEAGAVGYGPYANSSKYTKFQLLKVFSMLISDKYNSFKDISKRSKIDYNVIRDISRGKLHVWLKDKYPDKYTLMIHIHASRRLESETRMSQYYNAPIVLISPLGDEFKVNNLSQFCKEHNLYRQGISRVVRKERPHHSGWKLKK